MPLHLPILLLLSSTALYALSGVPGLLLSRKTMTGQRIATHLSCIATLIGLTGVAQIFLQGTDSLHFSWNALGGGSDGVVLATAREQPQGCCAVPVAVFRAMQVAAGVALPKDITLTIGGE